MDFRRSCLRRLWLLIVAVAMSQSAARAADLPFQDVPNVSVLDDHPTGKRSHFGTATTQVSPRDYSYLSDESLNATEAIGQCDDTIQQHSLDARHLGLGFPLEGTSWLNRPFHVGWLFGGLLGGELIEDRVEEEGDMFGGYRLGWDFDHYWGTEARMAFSHLDVVDAGSFVSDRTARNHFYDLNLLYYPWGDSRWRPFVSAGVGIARIRFQDDLGLGNNETLLHIPLGMGCKYYFRNWLAVRFTMADNISVAAGELKSLHQLSITGDVEVHFGGRRTSYFPWNSNLHLW